MLAIIAIVALIIVGIIWYLQQEKVEEEVAPAVAVLEVSSPSGLDVDTARGVLKPWRNTDYRAPTTDSDGNTTYNRDPNTKSQTVGIKQVSYIVPVGGAKSGDDCRAAAERLGHKSWGWNKTNNSCFAYIDNNLLQRMSNSGNIDQAQLGNYVLGCTQPGMKVIDGCEDWNVGDRVRGSGGAARVAELTPIQKGISLGECIAKGKAQDKGAIRYYTNNHSKEINTGRCFEIIDTSNLVGYTGNPNDFNYVQACTDPSKKIINGCE